MSLLNVDPSLLRMSLRQKMEFSKLFSATSVRRDIGSRIALSAVLMGLAGCVALIPQRTQFGVSDSTCVSTRDDCGSDSTCVSTRDDCVCVSTSSDCRSACVGSTSADCNHNAWETIGQDCYTGVDDHRIPCELFFVEFDDQGLLYPKPDKGNPEQEQFGDAWNQIEFTLERLHKIRPQEQSSKERQKLTLVVYVHGWKHNASAEDSNVQQFREILKSISLVEKARSLVERPAGEVPSESEQPRKVVGIYLGWRGAGVNMEPFKEAWFYSRKMTAERVAQGQARYLLVRLSKFQFVENRDFAATCLSPSEAQAKAPVRMIIIGHSFGGLIVFNAISGSLIERLAEGDETCNGPRAPPALQPFTDMVILLTNRSVV